MDGFIGRVIGRNLDLFSSHNLDSPERIRDTVQFSMRQLTALGLLKSSSIGMSSPQCPVNLRERAIAACNCLFNGGSHHVVSVSATLPKKIGGSVSMKLAQAKRRSVQVSVSSKSLPLNENAVVHAEIQDDLIFNSIIPSHNGSFSVGVYTPSLAHVVASLFLSGEKFQSTAQTAKLSEINARILNKLPPVFRSPINEMNEIIDEDIETHPFCSLVASFPVGRPIPAATMDKLDLPLPELIQLTQTETPVTSDIMLNFVALHDRNSTIQPGVSVFAMKRIGKVQACGTLSAASSDGVDIEAASTIHFSDYVAVRAHTSIPLGSQRCLAEPSSNLLRGYDIQAPCRSFGLGQVEARFPFGHGVSAVTSVQGGSLQFQSGKEVATSASVGLSFKSGNIRVTPLFSLGLGRLPRRVLSAEVKVEF